MTEPLSRDEIDAEFARAHAGVVAERDALRVEVATLRKEREYRFADLTAARGRIEKLEAEIVPLRRVALVCRAIDAAANRPKYNFDEADRLDREMVAALAALAALDEEDGK